MAKFERIPKDVLISIVVWLDANSLIHLCMASRRIASICKIDECRFTYYRIRYNLDNKFSFTWDEYCKYLAKYKSILRDVYKMTYDGFRDSHYNLHSSLPHHNDEIYNCDLCATLDAKDFGQLLKILLNDFPEEFLVLNSISSILSARSPKNIYWLFKLCELIHCRSARSISHGQNPDRDPVYHQLPIWFVKKYQLFLL